MASNREVLSNISAMRERPVERIERPFQEFANKQSSGVILLVSPKDAR